MAASSRPQHIVCRSPVDGHIVAERPIATADAITQALGAARTAQQAWAARSIAERARLCSAMVDAMLATKGKLTRSTSRYLFEFCF